LKVYKPFAYIYTTEITLKGDSVRLFAFTWRRVHVEESSRGGEFTWSVARRQPSQKSEKLGARERRRIDDGTGRRYRSSYKGYERN
jgi:hypothetical protein